jgi:hypothetical protein
MTTLGISLPEGIGGWVGRTQGEGTLLDALDRLPFTPSHTAIWRTWDDPDVGADFPPTELLDGIHTRGITPVIFWQPVGDHAAILRGEWNDYLDRWALAARAYRKPIVVRYAHEQNGDWFGWSPGKGDNTAQSYRRMWRLVAARMPDNVRMWWCPNVDGRPMAETWPGERWVHLVGLDGYAWRGPRTSVAYRFGKSLTALRAITDKPVIVGEFGCAPGPDRERWLANGLRWFGRHGVDAALWFDIDMRFDGHPDWRMDWRHR